MTDPLEISANLKTAITKSRTALMFSDNEIVEIVKTIEGMHRKLEAVKNAWIAMGADGDAAAKDWAKPYRLIGEALGELEPE